MKRVTSAMFFVLVLMLALAQQRPAHAGIVDGSVSLDTSGLAGTFELAFVLIDGSGTGDANNTVTLGDFAFGAGGSAGTVDPSLTTGGVSGDFASGVSLTDSSFFNVFAETFTAGALLSFDFGLTTNLEAVPDALGMFLLQSDGTPIPSSDPSGAVLLVNIDSSHPAFGLFATDLTPAPIVTLAASAPEPSTLLLLAIALAFSLALAPGSRRRESPAIPPRRGRGTP